MNLSGKIIVITGAANGLGKALSERLMKKKAIVIGVDKHEGAANYFIADVTNEQQIIEVAQKVQKTYGGVDIWINNAGIWMPRQQLEEMDMMKVERLFEVNVVGTIHGSRAAVRSMKAKGQGSIVTVISTTAFDGMNGSSGTIYVASKYALRGFTNTLRDELKESGISVVGVYPSGMKTDMFNDDKPQTYDQFMSPDEVAEKIVANLEKERPEEELVIKRQ